MKIIIHVDKFGLPHTRTPYEIELTPEQKKFILEKLEGEDTKITGTFIIHDGEVIG